MEYKELYIPFECDFRDMKEKPVYMIRITGLYRKATETEMPHFMNMTEREML